LVYIDWFKQHQLVGFSSGIILASSFGWWTEWNHLLVLGKWPVGQDIIHCTVLSQRHSVGIIAVYSYDHHTHSLGMSFAKDVLKLQNRWRF
jgi:hypothetical protein